MNWYIGQEIVAIEAHIEGQFKVGDTFTIKGLQKSHCNCQEVLIDIGRTARKIPSNTVCIHCNGVQKNYSGIWWFSERRFAPLESFMQEQIEEIKKELTV